MKLVTWTDDNGYRRRAYIRNGDNEDHAPTLGVPADVPDLSNLDWESVQRDLHNLFTDRGYITWADVQLSQTGINTAVQSVLVRRIVQLYRQQETQGATHE
jgi:hypothetical protein